MGGFNIFNRGLKLFFKNIKTIYNYEFLVTIEKAVLNDVIKNEKMTFFGAHSKGSFDTYGGMSKIQ